MKNTFKSLLNLFNFKDKPREMSITELNAFYLRKEKIEKGKRARAYISEINKRYIKMSEKRKKNFFRKASLFSGK